MVIRFSRTYQKDYDTFGQGVLPNKLGALALLIPCIIMVSQPRLCLTHDPLFAVVITVVVAAAAAVTAVNTRALIACPHFFSRFFF